MKDAVITVLATIGGIVVVICLALVAAVIRGARGPSGYDEDAP